MTFTPRSNTLAQRPPAWQAEVRQRLCAWWWLKGLGVTAFIWLFFLAYFELLKNPASPSTEVTLTALDHAVPFHPPWLWVYLSLWVYVSLAPALQRSFWPLLVYGLWAGALCLTGLTLFYFFPSHVPLVIQESSSFPGFELLRGVDAAGNACPSMHVAIAAFSAVSLNQLLRQAHTPAALRWLNAAWCVAIIYSTLAIKQHVVLDVVAGLLLSLPFAWAVVRWTAAVAGDEKGSDSRP